MHSLGDIEFDFIRSDLKSRGIVSEDLRDNLLDHICCIIENEITVEDDFKEFYEGILPRFFEKELSEIQAETTNLLKFKNFYTMKKILKFSGITTVVFITLGALFKTMHWPGASLFLILGGSFFSILFMPLLILLKLNDDESKTEKYVFSFGLLLAIGIIAGIIFKIFHWPYANNLMFFSTVIFTFLFVPVYFITGVKQANRKFNVSVNSVLMLACGGIFYSMFDMSYSRKYVELMSKENVYLNENAERIMKSNNRLLAGVFEEPEVNEFHQLSRSLNSTIETLLARIEKNRSTNELFEFSAELYKDLEAYNVQLENFKVEELSEIEISSLKQLNKLNPDIAMNVLARTQQQVAVNENCYLTAKQFMK
tara:strand:+ start:31449 stop:32552 length:1104 start_codon:yes stop_codon:yes gene_type:complete